MLRALKVLLAASLALPAPGWAAEMQAAAPSTVALPAAAATIPALPGSVLPTAALPSTLAAPASIQAAAPAAAMPPSVAARASATSAASAGAAAHAVAGAKAAAPRQEGAQGRTALQRLAAEVPFSAPQNGDASAEKAFADKSFGFKLGEASRGDGDETAAPEAAAGARRGGGSGGSNGGSGGGNGGGRADDGGGDKYPGKSVRFRGKLFRRQLFRPNVPVEPEIIRALDTAKKSLHIALYEFKLPGVLDALRRARDRGVEVHIVLDYSNVFPRAEDGDTYKPRRSREIWALLREGFDVKVLRGLSQYGINHNKFVVIDHGQDESMVEFGSYNWSRTAEESHYENANFATDKRRVEALKSYWDWLHSLAVPEAQARDHAWPATVPAPPVKIAEDIAFNGIKLPALVLSPSREPGKNAEDRLVQAYDAAQKSIAVTAFAIRSTKIVEALARAKKRGVKVRVIMDEGQSKSGPFGLYAEWLAAQGIEVRTLAGPDPDSDFPLAQKSHHKFSVIDNKLVETGSTNYTKYGSAANFENMHFLDEQTDVDAFAWIYERMFKRAAAFPAPAAAPTLPTDAELEAEISQAPPPAPKPQPHPGPQDPSAKPRDVTFNGKTFPSYAFRPDTPIEPMVVQAIDAAKKSVRMAVYEFNLPDVLDALRRAKKRGLTVELVIDRSHIYTTGKDHKNQPRKPSDQVVALVEEGFDLLVLKGEKSGIMHNKYMVLDAETGGMVEFGSYNYALTAERNHYENVKFSNDKHDVADYLAYFQYKRGLADPVDHDKLESVLNGEAAGEQEVSEHEAAALESAGAENADVEAAPPRKSGDERDSKFPPPPESTAPMITYNGEQFHRHYFSPQGGILDAWMRAVKAAEKSIDIAMFGFYSREVADAIVERIAQAKKDGTEFAVRMVLDAGQSSLAKFDGVPVAQWLAARGVDVRMKAGPNEDGDPMFEKQHSKFILVDGKLLMTGSFNLSPTAENLSFENENVVDDPTDVRGFVEFFMRMFNLGWPPRGSGKAPATGADGKTHTLPGL